LLSASVAVPVNKTTSKQFANLLSGNQQGKRKGLQLKLITILRKLKPHLTGYSESIGQDNFSATGNNKVTSSTVPKGQCIRCRDVYVNNIPAADAAPTQTPTQTSSTTTPVYTACIPNPAENSKSGWDPLSFGFPGAYDRRWFRSTSS
jgi:hypothetical protein